MPKRKKSAALDLPTGVRVVRSRGRTYYYFAPNRGTSYAAKPIPLGSDPREPEFWEALKLARGDRSEEFNAGSFSALIAAYKNAARWRDEYSENTRQNYDTAPSDRGGVGQPSN